MGAQSEQNDASRRGAAIHTAKMRAQAAQLKGEGATTGGFGTSLGISHVKNSGGKFYSKGKHGGK